MPPVVNEYDTVQQTTVPVIPQHGNVVVMGMQGGSHRVVVASRNNSNQKTIDGQVVTLFPWEGDNPPMEIGTIAANVDAGSLAMFQIAAS